MEYLAGEAFLDGLPLILAGPVLRRTEPSAVTVWLALKHPCRVRLQILKTQQNGQQIAECVLQGQAETTALGQHLHVVAVTARSVDGEALTCNLIYAYDLQFKASQASSQESISLTAALRSERLPTATVSYFAHEKPTFALSPARLDDLKIVHGSCRKPHGAGFDALPLLDCLIEAAVDAPHHRPHQLFLTGDQIYGDDVADPLLWVATTLGDTLLGWEEALPIGRENPDDIDYLTPKQLPAGKRSQLATRNAGFTAGLDKKHEKVTSHFLSFGEYCAVYVLARSPACWPVAFPRGREVTEGREAIRRWDKDRRHMQQFVHTLWKVRRALANVPTYAIFDDHDVSDDWNLNQAWCLRVLGRPLGRRAVQNAMLAYAVFQAWGNTPWQFEAGQSGAALLQAAQRWSKAQGRDQAAASAIATHLGLPPSDPHTGLPQFVEDGDVWVLQRANQALTWHYTVRGPCHEVIVLDTRTWRGYPDTRPIDPPRLLSPSAFDQQISRPLSQTSPMATFVVASTNVFGMKVLDWIQQWQLKHHKVFSADVGDSWNLNDKALATLLTTLFRHRQSVVVLSGDIHYSSAVRLTYQTRVPKQTDSQTDSQTGDSGKRATLVQLTSSAMKNEELLTQVLHTRLKEWLLPEKSRRWVGWSSPPDMAEQPTSPASSSDWRCQLDWLRRQPAQPAAINPDLFWLMPPQANPNKFARSQLFQWLRFWNARWFQEGQEVVGVNNIALVHFQAGDQDLAVRQDHYWFSSWKPLEVVRSRFETGLQ
ncbi:MAG: PhoD-like phosphatase [Cyanobacteria bacterium P01_G01_bin.38]